MRKPSISLALRLGAGLALIWAGGFALAQIEGSRGAAPIDSSGSFEVSGVAVDVVAGNAEAARLGGWRLAQRKGWAQLSQRLTGRNGSLSDSALDSLVTGIIVENEQIGPKRYIAKLGILFNRARAAQILGVSNSLVRSPPMLVMPIVWSGGVGTTFDAATPWQAAWARFRTGNSSVDYIRPAGSGPDSLLLNAGQQERPGRGWWRTILDQYGADDVLFPEVRLYRQWPGGPVIGAFRAGYGPDNRELTRFTLRVENGDGLPALLDAGVKRMDEAYQAGLRSGMLQPDALLRISPPDPNAVVAPTETIAPVDLEGLFETPTATATTFSIQFDTPSAAAVASSEAALRGIPGVQSAITGSLALGGVSVMRVNYDGSAEGLAAALAARGWDVDQSGTTLRIRRAPAAAPTPVAPPAPAEAAEDE
ncbi:heavy-metal-associated domain-containing protein [Sphingomonas sp. S1-29]|uniref:heavy-metal-associated domain-containing protein n=1 Tax=Sphingomonas sp. S1-29 TaxID=2991074 RepID=UPI00223F67AF|nr:heavy-metal-associated domain-containing protein [Sphingomonas sp. S1-29]UZK69980.1 heavy-metal-associated domain-containing protein [Sphingomonas sp. S1-29]